MKRYITTADSISTTPTYSEDRYDYWTYPEIADRVTETELADDVKSKLIEDEIEHVGSKYKYGSLNTTEYSVMWDLFLAYFVGQLEWILDDEPDLSWPTWYEDAKSRFDEWYNWWNNN